MEDLKQTPPASIESDAPSEYMRGYSDGLAQAEETISAAIQRAKAEEREACAKVCVNIANGWRAFADSLPKAFYDEFSSSTSRGHGAEECASAIEFRP